MQPILENPFPAIEAAVATMRQETPVIFVDAHGEHQLLDVVIHRIASCREKERSDLPATLIATACSRIFAMA